MPEPRQLTGRVIKSFGKRFVVATDAGTFDCTLPGRFRLTDGKSLTPVAVGDQVTVRVDDPSNAVIQEVHPRRNKLSRPDSLRPEWEHVFVANCDQMVAVASLAQPPLRHGAIDRFLVVAEKNRMAGAVVLNKIDLVTAEACRHSQEIFTRAGYPVVLTCALDQRGLSELRELVRGRTSIFVGHSGVGKSSLLNALDPGLTVRTGEVSEATDRGVHTTTTVELHPLSFDGYIADTPGLRAIGMWDVAPQELPNLFREFVAHAGNCRFGNCVHIGEPDCAVLEAVNQGVIARERYDGYLRIRESLLGPTRRR